jgi:hypothetical protein
MKKGLPDARVTIFVSNSRKPESFAIFVNCDGVTSFIIDSNVFRLSYLLSDTLVDFLEGNFGLLKKSFFSFASSASFARTFIISREGRKERKEILL